MRFTLRCMLSVVLLFALAVPAYAVHQTLPSETPITEPGANAQALYSYITKQSPYTQWDLWPNKGKFYKGTEPHGALLTTYVNKPAYNSIKKKRGTMDYGSIIVKENYTSDKKFIATTVMYKLKGYNPEGGDWFWANYKPDGSIAGSGKIQACIACHAQAKSNDYIFTGKLK